MSVKKEFNKEQWSTLLKVMADLSESKSEGNDRVFIKTLYDEQAFSDLYIRELIEFSSDRIKKIIANDERTFQLHEVDRNRDYKYTQEILLGLPNEMLGTDNVVNGINQMISGMIKTGDNGHRFTYTRKDVAQFWDGEDALELFEHIPHSTIIKVLEKDQFNIENILRKGVGAIPVVGKGPAYAFDICSDNFKKIIAVFSTFNEKDKEILLTNEYVSSFFKGEIFKSMCVDLDKECKVKLDNLLDKRDSDNPNPQEVLRLS